MQRQILCLAASLILLSCRQTFEPLKQLWGVEGGAEILQGSYLIGVCNHRSTQNFLNFQEELDFAGEILSPLSAEPSVRELSFITTLEDSASSSKLIKEEYENILGSPIRAERCTGLTLASVDFNSKEEAEGILSNWLQSEQIVFWEPNRLNRLLDLSNSTRLLNSYLQEGSRWWTNSIHLIPALEEIRNLSMNLAEGPSSPVIAVLDSGIDYQHPALKDRIWQNPDFKNSVCLNDRWGCNTVAGDSKQLGNGEAYPYGADRAGQACPLRDGTSSYLGECLHGTHVAGLIAGDLKAGVPGVCPFCRIMNVRVLENIEGEGRVPDSAVLRALKYLSLFEREPGKNLVRVVNLSFGKYQKSRAIALYIKYLANLRDGILVIAAAGNEDSSRRVYPAAHPSVLSVTSLAASGRKASYANYGLWVSVAAPGGEVREGYEFAMDSSIPGGAIGFSQGTSMATPVVAGIAGLILSVSPSITLPDLKRVIINSADGGIYEEQFADGYNYRNYYPKIDSHRVPLLGSGMVNAAGAVRDLKRSGIALKKTERIKIYCSAIGSGLPTSSSGPWLFLILPLFLVLVAGPLERITKYDSQKNSR